MRFHLLMAMASAVLLLVPVSALAQESESARDDTISGRTLMQQNANESAQATTDMSFGQPGQPAQGVRDVSYGGVNSGHSEEGGPQSRPCSSGSLCRVYFGQ